MSYDDQARGLRALAQSLLKTQTRVVAVVSGKGGVGKTFVSTSLALCASAGGKRVLLVDADLSLANVDIVLGVRGKHHLGEVLDKKVTFQEALVPGPGGIFVLPASAGVAEMAQIGSEQQKQILEMLGPQLATFDVVIFDCGAGVGDNVVFFARAAHEVLLVLTPEPTSLSDAYATIKVLHHFAGVDVVDVLVNQATESTARDVFRRLSGVAGRFLTARLRFKGCVPLDDGVRQAVLAQKPLVQAQPAAPAAKTMNLLTRGWLIDEPRERRGLLGSAR